MVEEREEERKGEGGRRRGRSGRVEVKKQDGYRRDGRVDARRFLG